jgi:hypothetical protein
MTKRLIAVFIWVLVFAVTAMIVGTILDFIPWDIRRYLGYVIIPVAVLWFLWSWFKWHAKQRADQNELDVLEETVQEHERGRHDNTEYIKKQIFYIERDHKRTPEVQKAVRTSATRYSGLNVASAAVSASVSVRRKVGFCEPVSA